LDSCIQLFIASSHLCRELQLLLCSRCA
jgi:hypothetical protein